jgi:hypothetical protein
MRGIIEVAFEEFPVEAQRVIRQREKLRVRRS